MGSAHKFSFECNGIKVSGNNKSLFKSVLAQMMQDCGVVDHTNLSPKASLKPLIGEYWEGEGGYYAGSYRDENGEIHDLICATDDLNGDWVWGESGKTIEGADSKSNGLANTIAMAKAGSKLAKAAQEHIADGHEDFYLPSQKELSLCFVNLQEHFKREAYWSSTQCSAYSAWYQSFNYGCQDITGKSASLRARAVRRVIK